MRRTTTPMMRISLLELFLLASVLQPGRNTCDTIDHCAGCDSYPALKSCSLYYCTFTYHRQCTIPYCLTEHIDDPNQKCYECAPPFQPSKYTCCINCKATNTCIDDPNNCCRSSTCKECNPYNSDECTLCQYSFYLYKSTCVQFCPTNTYIVGMECFDCNPNCATCDGTTQCTSCLVEANSLPLCFCPDGTALYNSECVSHCPYLYAASNKICERICNFGKYPDYQPSSSGSPLFTCSEITSFSDDYCVQNIKQLPNSISFTFSQDDFSSILVNAFILDTPQICYTYSLEGINSFQFQQLSNSNDGSTNSLVYFVNITDVQDPNNVHCTGTNCFLTFAISWNNQIQLSYRISLKVLPKEIIQNSVSYSKGNTKDIQVICEDCIIPLDKILPSHLVIDCQNTIKCTKKSIIVTTDNLITITQILTKQPALNQTVFFLPHSLKLTYLDEPTGQQIDTFIRNYNFSNTIANQITYQFYSIAVKQANLTVRSTIFTDEGQDNNSTSEISSQIMNPSRLLISASTIPGQGKYTSDDLILTVIDNSSSFSGNDRISFDFSEMLLWGFLALLFGILICFGVVCFKKMKKTFKIREIRSNTIHYQPIEGLQQSKAPLQTISDDEQSYLNQQPQNEEDTSE